MIDTRNWFQIRPIYNYIQKQAENEKFLKYLEIGGTFSLIAIFLILAIMPTITTISSLIGSIKSKEVFIEKANAKVANFLKGQDNYAKFQEKYSLFEDSYPTLAKYYDGASNLATIYKDSFLDIDSLSLNLDNRDGKTGQVPFNSYKIDIVGQGQYSSILDMVKKLTNNRRLISPVTITLSQPKSDDNNQSGSNRISVNLSSDLYYLPPINEKK